MEINFLSEDFTKCRKFEQTGEEPENSQQIYTGYRTAKGFAESSLLCEVRRERTAKGSKKRLWW